MTLSTKKLNMTISFILLFNYLLITSVTPKNGMLISKDVSSSGDSGDSYKYGSLFRLCGKLTNLCPENSNCSHQAEICVVEGEREVESKIVYDTVHK